MERFHILIPLLLFVVALSASAEGTSVRGGGDPCENRFKIVRDDLKLWIHQGGPNSLDLPMTISSDEYSQAMLSQMETARVKCVGPGDLDYPVAIDGIPKVCLFESGSHGGQVICDFTKFLISRDSDQYLLVHHEYAGLSGLELPDHADSHYGLSRQLSRSLAVRDGSLKLVVLPKPKNTDIGVGGNSKSSLPDEEERVISASVKEEIACASTTKGRVFCWKAPESPDLNYANPELLNPPANLENPGEIVIGTSAACVVTDRGIQCWGTNAGELRLKASGWKNPKGLKLFLEDGPGDGWRYTHVLCAITDTGVKCTNGMESELPSEAAMPDGLLVVNQYRLCALKSGIVYCASGRPVIPDASLIPADLGRLRDVSFTPGGLNACGISVSKGLVCWGDPLFMTYLEPKPEFADALKVVATGDETCVITSDRHLKCWGEPYRNTNLVPDSFEIGDIMISGTNKCVINRVGKMRCLSDFIPDVGLSLTVPKEIRF